MTVMLTRNMTPEESVRAQARMQEEDLLQQASLTYRDQIAFAIQCYFDTDTFICEAPAVKDAIRQAMAKVQRTLTLCGVQPIVQFHAKALRERP